jgi:hypothetical protein
LAARVLASVALAPLVMSACEPGTLTEARDQLARGPADTVHYVLPITRDTFDVGDLELSQDTVIGDLVAVALDRETVAYHPADDLTFANIVLTALEVSFPPAALTAPPGTMLDTSVTYAGLAAEPRLQGIDSLRVTTGTIEFVTSNRLVEPVDYTVILGGFIDAAGDTLRFSGTIPAATGDGSYAVDVQAIDLTGVTIVPGSTEIQVDVTVTLSGSPLDAANAEQAILQTGSADFQATWLRGPLDPAVTPELTVDVSDVTEIPQSSLDPLGDFRDLLDDVTLETAEGRLRFVNSSGAPIMLSEFTVGVVALTAAGDIPIDGGTGKPAYETDGQGNPLVIPVPAAGETIAIARNADERRTVSFPMLVDRVVKLLLEGKRAALLGAGVATIGDGQVSAIEQSDSLLVEIDVLVGVDATVPETGALYPPGNQINDGLGLQPDDAADVIDNLLVRAAASAEVTNETPFALEVTIAFIEGDYGETDVTTLPGSVILDPVRVDAPELDERGRVVTAVVDTVEAGITASQIGPLLGDVYTATVKATLYPGAGGTGRAALGVDDRAIIVSTVILALKRGGAGP